MKVEGNVGFGAGLKLNFKETTKLINHSLPKLEEMRSVFAS